MSVLTTQEIQNAIDEAWVIGELLHREMHLSGRVNEYTKDELDWMHEAEGACLCHIRQMSSLLGDFNPFGGRKA